MFVFRDLGLEGEWTVQPELLSKQHLRQRGKAGGCACCVWLCGCSYSQACQMFVICFLGRMSEGDITQLQLSHRELAFSRESPEPMEAVSCQLFVTCYLGCMLDGDITQLQLSHRELAFGKESPEPMEAVRQYLLFFGGYLGPKR
jgi:hypothetical protein